MKQVAIASFLSILIPAVISPASIAQSTPQGINEPATQPSINSSSVGLSSVSSDLTPFELVHLAYQGFLVEQGVPQFNRLTDAYRFGQLTAQDLVRIGIASRGLPAETVDDGGYINAVNLHLEELSRRRDS